MQNIIFLDIDGPMITNVDLWVDKTASVDQRLNHQSVGVVRKLCNIYGAKIVFNTYHNKALYKGFTEWGGSGPGLIGRFKEYGLGDYIHQSVSTIFPQYPRSDKLLAIQDWLAKNDWANWVCYDDEKINNPRAYQIDPTVGFDMGAIVHAEEWFCENPSATGLVA